ncbi:hypothetical protein PflQ2_3539 [Pseudomonas fluorescens Q2-87]|uniref:Uncharacterized protein n=1 Tax=Pseudomonas fluorescens (strain Q2-87) TaxID=1038922 RepID=J2MUB8_PSEFQ|nr:hypothetical protein [Pseudomonas fluorescens]EJL04712.1 hypothetical protein PflQ2_3539 [Pseudomonas fluorescens Q2-87]
MTLPDDQGLAIERRIIVFILELENDDNFFVKFKKERERLLGEFKDAGIKSLAVKDVMDEAKTPVANCKSWADKDKLKFKEYITYYCGVAEGRDGFLISFVNAINKINAMSGMPALTS